MPLATAEETTIVVNFPSAMAYGDFMQNAKFVVMYNGAIQTLTPTADSTGGKVSAPDTQMIAYWTEWEIPANQKQITLAPGRADWRLIAIYTEGDYYQLKPVDLEGLHIPLLTARAAANMVQNRVPLIAVLGGYLYRLAENDGVITFDLVQCSTVNRGYTTKYSMDYVDPQTHTDYLIYNYVCRSDDQGKDHEYVTDQFSNLEFEIFDWREYEWRFGQVIPFDNSLIPTVANDV